MELVAYFAGRMDKAHSMFFMLNYYRILVQMIVVFPMKRNEWNNKYAKSTEYQPFK